MSLRTSNAKGKKRVHFEDELVLIESSSSEICSSEICSSDSSPPRVTETRKPIKSIKTLPVGQVPLINTNTPLSNQSNLRKHMQKSSISIDAPAITYSDLEDEDYIPSQLSPVPKTLRKTRIDTKLESGTSCNVKVNDSESKTSLPTEECTKPKISQKKQPKLVQTWQARDNRNSSSNLQHNILKTEAEKPKCDVFDDNFLPDSLDNQIISLQKRVQNRYANSSALREKILNRTTEFDRTTVAHSSTDKPSLSSKSVGRACEKKPSVSVTSVHQSSVRRLITPVSKLRKSCDIQTSKIDKCQSSEPDRVVSKFTDDNIYERIRLKSSKSTTQLSEDCYKSTTASYRQLKRRTDPYSDDSRSAEFDYPIAQKQKHSLPVTKKTLPVPAGPSFRNVKPEGILYSEDSSSSEFDFPIAQKQKQCWPGNKRPSGGSGVPSFTTFKPESLLYSEDSSSSDFDYPIAQKQKHSLPVTKKPLPVPAGPIFRLVKPKSTSSLDGSKKSDVNIPSNSTSKPLKSPDPVFQQGFHDGSRSSQLPSASITKIIYVSREQFFGVKPDIISTLNGSGSNPPKCESNIASSSKVPNSKMVKSKKLQEFPNSTYSEFKISDGQKKEVASTVRIVGFRVIIPPRNNLIV